MGDKLTLKGIVALLILMILFSGIFSKSEGPLAALDLMNLNGSFGKDATGVDFYGKGGVGAKDGFVFTLTLIPTVMLALGIAEVCNHYGALDTARQMLTPLFRPLFGLPGVVGIAFSSSFMSSDVGSAMTRDLYKQGLITDNERTVFVSYQYAGSATITNVFGCGGALLGISLISPGGIIAIILICKVIGANLIRIYLALEQRRAASHGRGAGTVAS